MPFQQPYGLYIGIKGELYFYFYFKVAGKLSEKSFPLKVGKE